MIGSKISRHFLKAKTIAPGGRDFSRPLSELQALAGNSDWFIALFVSVVIGRSNKFGIDFSFENCSKMKR